jgi:uncharacterized repeat protein (TIGR01451 family)
MGYARSHLAARMFLLCCVLIASVAGSARAANTPVSNFGKTGTNEANGSSTAGGSGATAHAGDTIDWVLSYRNKTGSTANVNITDPITGNQDYVSGSLQTPPALDPQWSTNGGSSYVTSEPASGVNAIGAKGTSVDGSTGLQDLFSAPLASFNAGNTGGDGWEAMFIGNNIYNVFHHFGPGPQTNELDCHNKTTGAECPGFPVDYVSPNAGDPFGTGPDTLTSASLNNGAYNPVTGEIFWPSGIAGSTSIGVACANVLTMQSCGYTQLATGAVANTGVNGGGAPGMQGGKQVGTNYYTVATLIDGDPIFCFDMTTHALCAGWPAAGVPSDPGNTIATADPSVNGNTGQLESWGGYLFTAIQRNALGNPTDLGCIVIATQSPCSASFPIVAAGAQTPMAPMLDSSGTVTGVCIEDTATQGPGGYECYSLAGTSLGGAPWAAPPGINITGVSPEVIGTRVYLSYRVNATGQSIYTCYDFSTNSACQGFVNVSSGQNVRVYTLRKDPQNPDCIWELGDAGIYEVFSATFGGSVGCKEGNAQVQVTPAAFYCDGSSGHVTGWDRIRLHGVTSAQFDAVAVTITDSGGNPVPGWTNRIFQSNQVPIDISSIPYSGSTTTLNVQMVISWGSHAVVPGVTMDATFTGDAPQVCYQTKVGPGTCASAHNLDNQGNAVTDVPGGPSDAPDGNDSETATFVQPADATLCKWDLGVKKTAGRIPYVPGSDEPFQITVTNYGPDDARNVQINDPLPAGLTFVSGSDGCSLSGASVICTISSLANGASHTFNISMHVPSSYTATIVNPVRACSDKTDVGPDPSGCSPPPSCLSSGACPCPPAPTASDPHPNVDCVPVPHGRWDLGVTKQPLKSPLVPGTDQPYRIVVTNYGPDTAYQVTIKDALPTGLSFRSGAGCSASGSVVTCTLDSLDVGASHTYDITTHVSSKVAHSLINPVKACSDAPMTTTACDPPKPCKTATSCNGVSCSTAQAAAKTRATDPHPNIACAKVPLAPRLRLTKKANHTVVSPGQILTYTIKATNPGSVTLLNVRTCDDLPSGLAYVSSNPQAQLSGGKYCWNVKRLSGHKSKTYKIRTRVLNGSSSRIPNTATASADNARKASAVKAVRRRGGRVGEPPVTG